MSMNDTRGNITKIIHSFYRPTISFGCISYFIHSFLLSFRLYFVDFFFIIDFNRIYVLIFLALVRFKFTDKSSDRRNRYSLIFIRYTDTNSRTYVVCLMIISLTLSVWPPLFHQAWDIIFVRDFYLFVIHWRLC